MVAELAWQQYPQKRKVGVLQPWAQKRCSTDLRVYCFFGWGITGIRGIVGIIGFIGLMLRDED